jgi:hypothetical protein
MLIAVLFFWCAKISIANYSYLLARQVHRVLVSLVFDFGLPYLGLCSCHTTITQPSTPYLVISTW